jgi:hypothetical protein
MYHRDTPMGNVEIARRRSKEAMEVIDRVLGPVDQE